MHSATLLVPLGTSASTAQPPQQSLSGPLPLVTAVFCSVEGGKQYAARHRTDARSVHLELLAVSRSVLRHVLGGYLVKHQAGELKYLFVFSSPEVMNGTFVFCGVCAIQVRGGHASLLPIYGKF